MEREYVSALVQGLEKKLTILHQIMDYSKEQKLLLQEENLDPDDLDRNMENKANLIEELEQLDKGFEQVYERVKEALAENITAYRPQVKRMQELIGQISAMSALIQREEAENKELAQQKFAKVKKQVREVKAGRKAVNQYYQNMMKLNYVDPQFVDTKGHR